MKKFNRIVLGVLPMMFLGLTALNYYIFSTLKDQIITKELVQLNARNQNVAKLTMERLRTAQLLLENSARVLTQAGITPQTAHETLKTAIDAVPLVRVIGMFDTDGFVRYSSRSVEPPKVNLKDRDYVSHWLSGGSGEWFLSGPVNNAVDGLWQISLSKPVFLNSKLWGVLAAVINVDHLGISGYVSPDATEYLTLLDENFILIDRFPSRPEDVGRSLENAELFKALAASPSGTVEGTFINIFTGESRIAAAHRFFNNDLVISSSRPLTSVLNNWRKLAAVSAGMSVLLVILMVVVAAAFLRDARLRRDHSLHLEDINCALESRTQEAERLARVKSDFLATMSHEIRTPLTAIMGMHDLCRHEENVEIIQKNLRVANGASKVLLEIINDILDSERLESGRLTLEAIPFELGTLIEQATATVQAQAAEKGLKIEVELPEDPSLHFVGDPMRLCQVLINLLGNAVKFTTEGEIRFTTHVSLSHKGMRTLSFNVTDTGPGIAADKINLLFQPFEQLTSSRARRSGGSGLGLSISKRLIEAMNGHIGVESIEGKGSRFWFDVELAEHTVVSTAGLPSKPEDPAGKPADILLVDDNEINRDLISRMLNASRHSVVAVDSGQAAIEQISKQRFDVILLDIQMPVMDGVETIRELHRRDLVQHTSVIALTANAMPEQVEEYVREGFNDCVAKPIVWLDLFKKIEKARAQFETQRTESRSMIIDWPSLVPIAEALGEDALLKMQRDTIKYALTEAEKINEQLSDTDLSAIAHALRGLLGNCGFVAAAAVLVRHGADTGRSERGPLKAELTDELYAAEAEIDFHFRANPTS